MILWSVPTAVDFLIISNKTISLRLNAVLEDGSELPLSLQRAVNVMQDPIAADEEEVCLVLFSFLTLQQFNKLQVAQIGYVRSAAHVTVNALHCDYSHRSLMVIRQASGPHLF